MNEIADYEKLNWQEIYRVAVRMQEANPGWPLRFARGYFYGMSDAYHGRQNKILFDDGMAPLSAGYRAGWRAYEHRQKGGA